MSSQGKSSPSVSLLSLPPWLESGGDSPPDDAPPSPPPTGAALALAAARALAVALALGALGAREARWPLAPSGLPPPAPRPPAPRADLPNLPKDLAALLNRNIHSRNRVSIFLAKSAPSMKARSAGSLKVLFNNALPAFASVRQDTGKRYG